MCAFVCFFEKNEKETKITQSFGPVWAELTNDRERNFAAVSFGSSLETFFFAIQDNLNFVLGTYFAIRKTWGWKTKFAYFIDCHLEETGRTLETGGQMRENDHEREMKYDCFSFFFFCWIKISILRDLRCADRR